MNISSLFSKFVMLLFTTSSILAQKQGGGKGPYNQQNTPCLSTEHRQVIFKEISENREKLKDKGIYITKKATSKVGFIWPVRQASGFNYNSTWAISNYVDHNPQVSNMLSDYNCGNRTYDTSGGYNHQGIDIYTWPFSYKQQDDNQTEIVAAASGQIINKFDGSFDRNCQFNNDLWNAVYIEHSDGSISWYGHMKNGSLTSKEIGDTVDQGEYLGIIGSSGNSTGPHLHFETYDVNNNLIDPYSGPCNTLNTESWWINQKEYLNPKINAILTHSSPPQFLGCPNTEVPNIENEFDINASVIFAAYFVDQQIGAQANYAIYRPSGALFTNWTQTFDTNYYSSYWYWTVNVDDSEGQWRFEVSHNNQTVNHVFTVVNRTLSVRDTKLVSFYLYPNPVDDLLNIETPDFIKSIVVSDINGKVFDTRSNLDKGITTLDSSQLRRGIYFIRIETKDNIEIHKIIKK